ncbi:MAG TPA: ATP-binding cassette domain-containing protein [Acidobacteriota bacterium]|nr:ATP-binding cassette domain-containing protein [Acidobacteriota bacterium]
MMQLRCDQLSVSYASDGGSPIPALRDVSLSLTAGERVAIVGPNGSGKSTLALVLAGVLPPSRGQIVVDENRCDSRATVPRGTVVFQAPEDNLIADSVFEEMALTLEHCLGRRADDEEARQALANGGVAELTDRRVGQLSGGEKQRVAVACALAAGREMLVLDEPTSHLDPPGRRSFFQFLASRHRHGLETAPCTIIILVTQYEDEARHFERVIHLDAGRVIYDGPGDTWGGFGSDRQMPDVPAASPAAAPTLFVQACGLTQVATSGRPLPESSLAGIDLEIQAGEAIGLCGPIGSGKTTLAYHLAGLVDRWQGTLTWHTGGFARNKPVVLIQFPERQLFAGSVMEDVAYGPRALGGGIEKSQRDAEAALAHVGLAPEIYGPRSPFALSGGERRRAAMAGVAAVDAPLYILDEPTAALDGRGLQRLAGLCAAWRREGRSCILISHDLAILRRLTERVWVMERGRLIYDGTWVGLDGKPGVLAGIGF